MTIIDKNTVVVFTSAELKTALEQDNGYTYIYFGNNITLTSGITISPYKSNIIIDGTYNENRYTFQDMKSSGSGDTISVRNKSIQTVTVQNINVVGNNYYGIIYVAEDNNLQNVIIEYNNLEYTGPQITFHPTGLSRYINCNITIKASTSPANEVAECNRIEIGGITTILHTSTGNSSFWFRGSQAPYFKILKQANVTITSQSRELFYGVTNLEFDVLQEAMFVLTTYYGMAYGTYSTGNVLLDKGSTFTLTQTGRQGAYPTWYCNGAFTINENASFSIINKYSGITNSNYNIYFRTPNASLTFNNPKQIILYNSVADIFYTDSTIPFTFTYSRINFWSKGAAIDIAGSLEDLPTYSWYKNNELSIITGTFSPSTTTIKTNNYTPDELAELPALSNFIFQNKKVLSIGKFILNIDAITDKSLSITGHTIPSADIKISFLDTTKTITANENGIFELTLTETLPIGTDVSFMANKKNSFIYQTKTVQIVYSGELTLDNAPSKITFSLNPFSTQPVLCPRNSDFLITVTDTRIYSSAWKLYGSIKKELTSKNGYTLKNSLVFIDNKNDIIPLSTKEILIYQGENNGGTTKITNINFKDEQGIILQISNDPIENGEEYSTQIIWNLKE